MHGEVGRVVWHYHTYHPATHRGCGVGFHTPMWAYHTTDHGLRAGLR